jgi:hypothetical protein
MKKEIEKLNHSIGILCIIINILIVIIIAFILYKTPFFVFSAVPSIGITLILRTIFPNSFPINKPKQV